MERTIKYLKRLSRRSYLEVKIFKVEWEGTKYYDVYIRRIDSFDAGVSVEYRVDGNRSIKAIKKDLASKLNLRFNRKIRENTDK